MASKKDNPMLDPIAYREDYPEENIIGTEQANESFSAYGDDSDLAHQQQSLGGMNDKYGGEGVGVVNYNEDATLSNLPNYIYGKEANQTGIEGYLSKRNDNVASALFNEGKLTKEDVVNYLAQQQGWNNSSEMDRMNTVESIWKRIGNLQGNGEQKEEAVDTSRMEQDLNKDTSGTIYGKTTAEEGKPKEGIDTLEDKNSVFQMMNNARIAAVEEMISMGVDSLAAMQYSGTNPYNETNWRDFRKYYPDMAAQVDQKVKEMNGQDVVNAIASGKAITTTADKTDVSGQATSYAVNNASGSTTATQLLQGINSILESNDTAKSAEELMGSIEKDMATLKNKMKNLKSEASNIFKGDVPDYLVNAYINNKSQEIQNQLSILEDRYNAAYNRYKTELSHAEWEAEYKLKQESLALDEWKAKNTTTTTTTNTNYTVAERNNNPTNMTVGFMERAGAELGVDYEVSTDSFWSDGKQLYYAKLIGDPIDTTIRILDKAIANGKNPFNTTSWSYINKLGLTVDKWNKMSQEEKQNMIRKWLPYEGGKMENMAYYVSQNKTSAQYNEDDAPYYQKLLDADYTAISRPEKTAQTLGYGSVANFRAAALAWRDAEKKRIEDQAASKPAKWKRKDGVEFDMADTPTYDTLTYDQQNIVQQLLNLNKNPATVTKRQYGDDFEKILSAVKEINPNRSDADYGQADKVKKEWNTSSKNGSNSRNGTAIATAMDIYDIADEFGNLKWKDWNGMLNKLKDKLSDEAYTKLLINLEVLASEYAGALKGNNAAPTEQEIADKKEILAANLGAGAMKEAAIQIAKTLYNKNANEADNYKNVTLVRPPLVVTNEVADWMYNIAGIKTLPDKYQYTPKGMSSGGGNAPLTGNEYTYEGGILSAINQNKTKGKRF